MIGEEISKVRLGLTHLLISLSLSLPLNRIMLVFTISYLTVEGKIKWGVAGHL